MLGFLIGLLNGALAAAAVNCGTVDVRPQLGKVRNQGETSWCASHVVADLLSQKYRIRIAPGDLATQFVVGNVENLRRSSVPAVRDYVTRDPQFFPRTYLNRSLSPNAYRVEFIFTPQGPYNVGANEDAIMLLGWMKGFCLDQNLPDGPERYERYLLAIESTYRSPGDPASEARHRLQHFENWMDIQCGRRLVYAEPPIPRAKYHANGLAEFEEAVRAGRLSRARVNQAVFDEIDAALDAGKAASVAFNVYDLMTLEPGDDPMDGDHAAVIAARKMIGGRCHYFVRNSYGEDCDYRAAFRSRCELRQGGVWVTPSEMLSAYSTVWIP